jgi:outer membrane protein OmpA-like peptidoglycan-associated protein
MQRRLVTLILCGGIGVLASACATKGFVREQVGTTETRLSQRVDTQESQLRQTSERVNASTQALESTGQRVQGLDTRVSGLDTRVGEVQTLASDAKKDAAAVAAAQRDAEAQFTQRFANRNKYSTVDTKMIFFDFAKADLRDEGINELEDVARALKADPNASLELQGFADPRGTDRYNYQLTRDRVDSVVRYLVQRHGIDLRRIHAVGMGKAAPVAGEKPNKDTLAKSRRVEIRLVAPQS